MSILVKGTEAVLSSVNNKTNLGLRYKQFKVQRRIEAKNSFKVGIVSWGIGCGGQSTPAVYTNVAEVACWIDAQVCTLNYLLFDNLGCRCDVLSNLTNHFLDLI